MSYAGSVICLEARRAVPLAGGVLYTVGVGFHLWRALPFRNAIWHGLILAAAGCHYAAILYAGLA